MFVRFESDCWFSTGCIVDGVFVLVNPVGWVLLGGQAARALSGCVHGVGILLPR